uniref:Uncharacterized protein n=1 Tax=Parascaris equorum TaxID=6256 RepID=A0A914RSB9_PAREQ
MAFLVWRARIHMWSAAEIVRLLYSVRPGLYSAQRGYAVSIQTKSASRPRRNRSAYLPCRGLIRRVRSIAVWTARIWKMAITLWNVLLPT